jgi:hypothetical protein
LDNGSSGKNKSNNQRWGRPASYALLGSGVLILFIYEPIAFSTGIPRLIFQLGSITCIIAALFIFMAVREPVPDRREAYREVFQEKETDDFNG